MNSKELPPSRHTLKNENGMEVDIVSFGATIAAIRTPDKEGKVENIVFGFENDDDYRNKDHPHYGGTIGRTPGRIANHSFKLNEETYDVTDNFNGHHLHGGDKGFDKRPWSFENISDTQVTLYRRSQDGEENYPGALDVRVTYTLDDNNALKIRYDTQAIDKATPVNLTNHSYFNLRGDKGHIGDHHLSVCANKVLATDSEMIPTGETTNVANTKLDFRQQHPLNKVGDTEQHGMMTSLDHSFVIADNDQHYDNQPLAAHLEDPKSGRVMDVYTSEPMIQVYTPGSLPNYEAGGGSEYSSAAICLETQHAPDSVNHPEFPTTILEAGERSISETIYKFSTIEQQPPLRQ